MTQPQSGDFQTHARLFCEGFKRLHDEVSKVIVGNVNIIDEVLISLFAGGHCLLEGVPGLGKTMLVSTLSKVLDLNFSRVQFTPDLMPSDIVGTHIINELPNGRREFTFEKGPIFANVVLADEINRATPKTQSALLEAMQEKMVTVGGTHNVLDPPFFVLATQNPLEMEGTYPLPEAQLDRFFFKILVGYPNRTELSTILTRTTRHETPQVQRVMDKATVLHWINFARQVVMAEHVQDYAVRIILATQPTSEYATPLVKKYVKYGSSPRGAQALTLAAKIRALLDGRFNASFSDVEQGVLAALRHRMILNFEADADGITSDHILSNFKSEIPRQAAEAVAGV
ncbi:MoxR family ATPase [Candidatus Sumerlaeota bacterium]|nr:MoxR family ATPase [Candidatus Sumerlaeota bacterium]